MNSYYSIQISETEHVRIPMVQSLRPDAALLLGALVASKNKNLATLIEDQGELLLGCVIGAMLEGSDPDFGSPESISLSKMLVADVVSLIFQAFETLEKSMAEARGNEEAEGEPDASEDEGE